MKRNINLHKLFFCPKQYTHIYICIYIYICVTVHHNTIFCEHYDLWRMNYIFDFTWWRHRMETFPALKAICAENSPVSGEFPTQRPVTRSFDVFFDLRPNEPLCKHSWGWWLETQSSPLWRHSNDVMNSRQGCHTTLVFSEISSVRLRICGPKIMVTSIVSNNRIHFIDCLQ